MGIEAARSPALVVSTATAVGVGVLGWSWRAFGPDSRRFAFIAVWAPMTWLGTVSKVAPPSLPERYHALRRFERGGARVYELAGVRVVKSLLRRGPIAVFNPGLHLPSEPTPDRIAQLDQRMRVAEASHTILFLSTIGATAGAWARGRLLAARWMLLANVVLNGYPVMLQRYNRALLADRYPPEDGLRNRGGTADR